MSYAIRNALLSAQILICAAAAGCASAPVAAPVAMDAALPEVAAQYRTRITHRDGSASQASQWRMWRTGQRVVRENLDERTGETWQRDGDELFMQKLYHAERRGIEFVKQDLRMVGAEPSWERESLIVDPGLLAALPLKRVGVRDGHPFRRYAGKLNGVAWAITLRTDLMLPTQVVRDAGTRVERVELVEAKPLADASWQPTASDGYDILDYADLGDHENDPFVMRLQHPDLVHAH